LAFYDYPYFQLYAVLFLVGVCGNVSVITLIRHLHANTSYDNTMIYVLFLCCVDLASVVPLPMAIMDQVSHRYPWLRYSPRLLVLNLASIWGFTGNLEGATSQYEKNLFLNQTKYSY
jgi:hypothetical protein